MRVEPDDCPFYPFNESAGLTLSEQYTHTRRSEGLLRVRMAYGEPAWLVTRYADARLVLGDRRFSRAAEAGHDFPRQTPGRREGGILSMDPPDHTRLRTLVMKAFTLHRVERLRTDIRATAEGLLDDLVTAGPPADLVEDFALPFSVAVICELLGVPAADQPLFHAWSDAALSTSQLTTQEIAANKNKLRAYIAELVAARRERPADDLITGLIEARDVDARLSERELIDLCISVLIAGHETTATQIPNFLYTLLDHPDHPDQLGRLRTDPGLIPKTVEELLRFIPAGAASTFPRYATEDIEGGGTLVRAGEPVLVSVAAANRDALRFTAPDTLDFAREGNQHLGFGHGVHHCLGAQLARVELQEALRALLLKLPGIRPAGDIVWKTEMLVRGPSSMPVTW